MVITTCAVQHSPLSSSSSVFSSPVILSSERFKHEAIASGGNLTSFVGGDREDFDGRYVRGTGPIDRPTNVIIN